MDDRTSDLRAHDAEALTAMYASMIATGSGRTVFVVGDSSAGRRALLRGWTAGLSDARPRPVVVGGAFQDGVYVPWERDRAAASTAISKLDRLVSAGTSVASLSEPILPAVASLLGQVLSKSAAALELSRGALTARAGADTALLVPRALRRLCDDGPVVCVVEADGGNAGGLWADLASLLARRVARDLPLLLVLAIDGPELLGPHDDDEPDALNVARQLTADDVDAATWQWLAPLSPRQVERWTGTAAPDVLTWLIEATDGDAGATAELWREWRARGVVDDVGDGVWRFATGRERRFDASEDAFDARLRDLTGGDLNAIGRATKALGCAALEGRRFTAPAIATALGRDIDETIDYLDDTLALGGTRPDGFVVDDGFETIEDERGTRHLAMYRFARELDWRIARRHGLSEAEERYLGPRLARAMASLYGGGASRVAHQLARLHVAAGDAEAARHFRRMADIGANRELLLWRARTVLAMDDPTDRAERRRASQLLVAASDSAYESGAFRQGLAFGEAAHRLAELRSDAADALYLAACALYQLRNYDRAREDLSKAARIYRDLGDRHGQAACRAMLAEIDSGRGHLDRARAELNAVVVLQRELKSPQGEAVARHTLAEIDGREGHLDRARAGFTDALTLYRQADDRRGEAIARREIAEIDFLQGDADRARAELHEVIALCRELGNRSSEAFARWSLAEIDRAQGHVERARRELTILVELFGDIGDPESVAACRRTLDELARG